MTNISNNLPVWGTISLAWSKVYGAKGSFWMAIFTTLLIIFGLLILSFIAATLSAKNVSLLILIATIIIYCLLDLGLFYIGIKRADDSPISYRLMFRSLKWDIAFKLIGLYLLKIIIFIPGLILVILPWIIQIFMHAITIVTPFNTTEFSRQIDNLPSLFMLQPNLSLMVNVILITCSLIGMIITLYLFMRLLLSLGLVLDKAINPWQAIVRSFQATRHQFWRLLGIHLLIAFIFMLGSIPFSIGNIWTIPLFYICYGQIYKTLCP